MTRSTLLILAPLTAVMTFGLLSAVGPESNAVATAAASQASGVSCVDDLGRTVTLESPAERVAVMSPFAVDVLLDLGIEPVLVPSMVSDQPESWDGLDVVSMSHSTGPNLEQVVASRPDLIIAPRMLARFIPVLESTLGIPVVCVDVQHIDHLGERIELIGKLVGQEAGGTDLAAKTEREVARAIADTRSSAPVVFAIFGLREANYAFLPDSYLGSLIEACGGQLLTERAEVHPIFEGFTPLSLEVAIEGDPSVVLVIGHGDSAAIVRSMSADPAWSSLSAVKAGRVVSLPEDPFVLRPGVEPLKAISLLREAMYPDQN
ncbi:MAG: ABC transporter substrate-binding protein [Planctomycetota bacterium]